MNPNGTHIPILRPLNATDRFLGARLLTVDEPSPQLSNPWVVVEMYPISETETTIIATGPFPGPDAVQDYLSWLVTIPGRPSQANAVRILTDPRIPCRYCGADADAAVHAAADRSGNLVDHRWEPDVPEPWRDALDSATLVEKARDVLDAATQYLKGTYDDARARTDWDELLNALDALEAALEPYGGTR